MSLVSATVPSPVLDGRRGDHGSPESESNVELLRLCGQACGWVSGLRMVTLVAHRFFEEISNEFPLLVVGSNEFETVQLFFAIQDACR